MRNRVTSQASGPKCQGPSRRQLKLNDRVLTLLCVQNYLVIGRYVRAPIADGLIELPSMNKRWKKNIEKQQKSQIDNHAPRRLS